MPEWFNPGTAPAQQSRAEQFDPYPEVDAGLNSLGVRPRDFDEPLSYGLMSRRRRQSGTLSGAR